MRRLHACIVAALSLLAMGQVRGRIRWISPTGANGPATVFFTEAFEDTNFAGRSWYDNTSTAGTITTSQAHGGTHAYQCHWTTSVTNCVDGDVARHAITPTNSVYVGYWLKHTSNFVGSNTTFHPHMFYILTTEEAAFAGLAYTHLTAYVENNYQSNGQLWFESQDGANIDENNIGVDLTHTTESRAIAGCNGDTDGYGLQQCFVGGSPQPTSHWNGRTYPAGTGFFDSTPGSAFYKGDWHHVECYFRLNSIVGGVGQKDGIVRYWYDGALVMEHTNIVLRTGVHATMQFNQVVLIPFIGVGSPVDQTMYIDDLIVANNKV